MKRVLDDAPRRYIFYDGGTPAFTTLANEEVSFSYAKMLNVALARPHRWRVRCTNREPVNMLRFQVRSFYIRRPLGFVLEHLAQLNRVVPLDRRNVPMRRNLIQPRNA